MVDAPDAIVVSEIELVDSPEAAQFRLDAPRQDWAEPACSKYLLQIVNAREDHCHRSPFQKETRLCDRSDRGG
jgi:hypothetical protein